jgi:hypothetical protein
LAHAASDPLAARIVLQRILPGLLHIVRREQRREPGLDAFDVLIGEAWVSIVNYSVADRPTHIASRLLHDARHRAFTNPRRRRRVLEVPCSPDRLTEPREPAERSALEELAAVIVEARRRGVHERDVEIVRGILRHGTATAFASELHLHPRSVRYRRDAALARIRRAAVADHAA